MINNSEQRLYEVLECLNIKYIKYEHEAVKTIEEANKLDISIKGQHCKNLFLRDKKGITYYLLVVDQEKHVDLKDLAVQIESTSLSFASAEKLDYYLGLKPGSVTPFGLINDSNKEVVVLIDSDLRGMDVINFHPNVNTATISVSHANLEKFIKWHENKLKYVDIK